MSLLSYREPGARDFGPAAGAPQDPSRSMGEDKTMPVQAWHGAADFNPLMERALRAQQMAEGRFYKSSPLD
ncbi:MAG: hypothetical protein RBU21_13600 [FCB group bacterium]|nr:hypothetical protein [FCB group bacterium]